MRSCDELEPLLAAYVDGEGAAGPARRGAARTSRAARTAGARSSASARSRAVLPAAAAGAGAQAPPQLRKRCAACVCAPRGRWRAAAPAASRRALAAAVVRRHACCWPSAAVFVIGLNGSVEALAAQLALDHVKCFQFAPAHADVDPTAAGATLEEHATAGSITVPRSAPVEQLELLDVRRCLSTQGSSAHIMYRWRGAPLSVYVLNSVPKSDVHVERLVVAARRGSGGLDRRRPHLRGGRPRPRRPTSAHRALPARVSAGNAPRS